VQTLEGGLAMLWTLIEKFSVVATVIGFPLTLVGLIALYAGWSRDMPNIGYILAGTAIGVGLLAYAVDLSDRFGWFRPPRNQLEHIYSRTYSNEVVIIDRKDFVNCIFNNVTFHHDGGNYAFDNATITGTITLETDNDDVSNAIWFLKYLDSKSPGLLAAWKKQPKRY
jgi:hypothetical protein